MKTLEEMYFPEVDKQPENKVSISDVLFISAFPGANIRTKIKDIKRGAEDTLDEFYQRWETRVREDTRKGLESGLQPQMLVGIVSFLTRSEMKEIIQGIDKYVPGDTEEQLALKITELESHYRMCLQQAGSLLQDEYEKYQVALQDKKIITINKPGGLILP
jgi:hypothetical protein